MERTFTSEHFSVTWSGGSAAEPDDADVDADGVPDAVERLAEDFEDARSFLLSTLGYSEPPGTGRYPLYIGMQGGYTRSAPSDDEDSRPSYIVVPASLVGGDASSVDRRTFVVHEYMHAVQEGYDHGEDQWIKEASSAWVEDLFQDEMNSNHGYLVGFIPFPRVGLNDPAGINEYGAFLFLQFLTEHIGGRSVEGADLIRELWERMGPAGRQGNALNLDSLDAIDALLSDRGLNFADVWAEFMFWRWRLANFEEGRAYRAAVAHTGWPKVSELSRVGRETCRVSLEELPPLSGDYVRLVPSDSAPSAVPLTIVARARGEATGFALVKHQGRPEERVDLVFDESGIASMDVTPDGYPLRRVTLNLNNSSLDMPHALEYSARWGGRSRVVVSQPLGPSDITFGLSVLLSGTLACGGLPAPFAEALLVTTDADGAVTTQTIATDEDGKWQARVTPEETSRYHVEVIDPLLSHAESEYKPMVVHVAVEADIADQTLAIGQEATVTGRVLPLHPAAPLVLEFRRPEGSWREGDKDVVGPDGGYQMSFLPPATGIWEVRIRVVSTLDSDHATGSSGAALISVSPSGQP